MKKSKIKMSNDETIKNIFKKFGSEKTQEIFNKQKKEWENCKIRFAIIGKSGVGKSTYLNTLVGKSVSRQSGAGQGTLKVYTHEISETFHVDDIPGFGTSDFNTNLFMNEFNIKSYDAILFLTDARFTSDEKLILAEVIKAKTPYFIIRTKFDQTIEGFKAGDDYEKPHPKNELELKEKVISIIRNDLNMPDVEVFVLSRNPLDWDFNKLKQGIENSLEGLRGMRFLTESKAYLKKDLIEKRKIAQKIVNMYSFSSAVVALVPIPGASFVADASCMYKISSEVKKIYQLDNAHLEELEKKSKLGALVNTITNELKAFGTVNSIVKWLTKQASKIAPMLAGQEVLKWIPLLGTVASAAISIYLNKWFGGEVINICEEAANAIIDKAMINPEKASKAA